MISESRVNWGCRRSVGLSLRRESEIFTALLYLESRYTKSMPIYLDDELVQLQGTDLKSVLSEATHHLADRGRIVVEVQVDGQPLIDDALDERYKTALAESEIRLYSANPQELAVMTLQQVKGKLEDARQAQSQAASHLQEDRLELAMQDVMRTIEVWQQTQQAVLRSAQLLGIDLDSREVAGQSVPDMTSALLEQVTDLRTILETGDTVGLADAMAYEWPATVQKWETLISEMIEWIDSETSGDKV